MSWGQFLVLWLLLLGHICMVMVNRAVLVLEHRFVALREVENVLWQRKNGRNVGNVHAVANVQRQDLCVGVSSDVGLNWDGNVAKVEEAAIFVRIEEGQVHTFMSVNERLFRDWC